MSGGTKQKERVALELHRSLMIERIPLAVRPAIEECAREYDARLLRDAASRKGGRPRKRAEVPDDEA